MANAVFKWVIDMILQIILKNRYIVMSMKHGFFDKDFRKTQYMCNISGRRPRLSDSIIYKGKNVLCSQKIFPVFFFHKIVHTF